MIYHVNTKASEGGDGSFAKPFQRIQEAADIAKPGDEVLVYPGIYREAVNPKNGGREDSRITYRSVEKGKAVITGAEPVKDWKPFDQNVWRAEIPNRIFTDRNPFTTMVSGDWFIASFTAHTGDVFLNGKSMYEVLSAEGVKKPVPSDISWDPDFSVYTWYAEQDEDRDMTILYANFQGKDPNAENVEISVRKSCFAPEEEGIGYITLSGFTVCQAATQWAPPTAFQEGMIAPHWSKGWIIEDCEVFESKCSGISLGKYLQPENDNKWLKWKYKDGTQTERDCILQAQREGFSKESIGSHIVRRCHIHDCGQTGIVGHLGGVFSVIEDNHIHHINNKQNLAGAEIGGIKMHAAIDVIYRRNHIHHCTRGLWLDWQAQGTRVTRNLFHDNTLPFEHLMREEAMVGNGEDIFVEVSHGPTLIDNNILLSTRALKLATQGVAVVHNLIAGSITAVGKGTDNGAKTLISPRYTPYHVPHQTEVAGFMTFLHGDDRFMNNIFIQMPVHPFLVEKSKHGDENCWDDENVTVGVASFKGYPTLEEWEKEFTGYCGMGSPASDRYYMHLPVWSEGNLFLNGALPWEKEKGSEVIDGFEAALCLKEENGTFRLSTNLDEVVSKAVREPVDTERLGMAFEPEQKYENPDGTPIVFNRDYFGRETGERPLAGPFADGKYDGVSLIQ
ncbi:MAG: right-handed parallel beta-helix repeat-containing protein [Lachnospiraceae bacterium]|nr:right-handed parallel beta-helix repeat-containing protein [Lachnospiraceae bacterium]